MGLEDIGDPTGLALGLGSSCKTTSFFDQFHRHLQSDRERGLDNKEKKEKKEKIMPLEFDHVELIPSLSLGSMQGYDVNRCISPGSSYSNSSTDSHVKKEKVDHGCEDYIEGDYKVGLLSLRGSDEDEEGSPRKKLRLTKEQSAILELSFKQHTTLTSNEKQALAKQLKLRPRQVEVWFQNRRARTKLKQTQLDCQLLKKCCQSLSDENNRLHRELQELRALHQSTTPPSMHVTAATLAICPSCEGTLHTGNDSSGGGGGPSQAQLRRDPFARSYATC